MIIQIPNDRLFSRKFTPKQKRDKRRKANISESGAVVGARSSISPTLNEGFIKQQFISPGALHDLPLPISKPLSIFVQFR
jgi:hypothetical protein